MQTLDFTQSDFQQRLRALADRPAVPPEIEEPVAEIIEAVSRFGDEAVIRYAEKFDRVKLTPESFQVDPADILKSSTELSPELHQAVDTAHSQILTFAELKIPRSWRHQPRPGVTVGESFHPLSRVAAYVPGGTAPLVSTVLHTVTLAVAAGVPEIVVTTPPGRDGKVDSALLYAAAEAGATGVYRLGGVYAIAALALGTESVEKVEKIVGPGNAYVTAAKKQLYGRVSLDMVAGPSEIMIIADHSADPRLCAADMLSQIEHGSGHEQAVLVSTSDDLIKTVGEQLLSQSRTLPRNEYIRNCLDSGVIFIHVADLKQALEAVNSYAPEHLELLCEDASEIASQVEAAGAVFIGPWTPEPVGDFVAGPSHVLPTGGAARYFSGLSVEQFFRRISIAEYDRKALERELPAIIHLAEAEGLSAHRNSAAIRFDIED